jgi:hypothetical protein
VCIQLQDRQRAMLPVCLQHRNRDRVVTADDDRQRSAFEHLSDPAANRVSIIVEVGLAVVEVAPVERADTRWQQVAVDIEIVVPEHAGPAEGAADRVGSFRAVTADALVRRRRGRADEDDIRVAGVPGLGDGQVEKTAAGCAAEHGFHFGSFLIHAVALYAKRR